MYMYMLQRIVQLRPNFIMRVQVTRVQTANSKNYVIGLNYWKLIIFLFVLENKKYTLFAICHWNDLDFVQFILECYWIVVHYVIIKSIFYKRNARFLSWVLKSPYYMLCTRLALLVENGLSRLWKHFVQFVLECYCIMVHCVIIKSMLCIYTQVFLHKSRSRHITCKEQSLRIW